MYTCIYTCTWIAQVPSWISGSSAVELAVKGGPPFSSQPRAFHQSERRLLADSVGWHPHKQVSKSSCSRAIALFLYLAWMWCDKGWMWPLALHIVWPCPTHGHMIWRASGHVRLTRHLMYSSSSSPFICPVELDQWYHSNELTLTISERPSTPSNPYVPEELWPLENCGGCGRMARNSQNAPNCRRHNSIHHL